jgi:phage gpG-like protein
VVTVSIKTEGADKVIRSMSRIGEKIDDFRDPFRKIASNFYEIEEKLFAKQGSPNRWQPLSIGYKKWKDRHYPGEKIMQLTHRLIDSLTGENQADAQDSIRIIKRKSMVLGTNVPYARRHHVGYKMPKREVIQLTERNYRVWDKLIQRWVFGLFEAEGLKNV